MKRIVMLGCTLVAVLTSNTPAAPQTPSPSVTELVHRTEQGDTQAMLTLGMRYRDGQGVRRDYKEAMKWYRRCADEGNAAGMDSVGFMHLKGWGVPEDFNIAAAYFKAAGAKSNAQGLYNLGDCYFSGQGVEQDYSMAIDSWQRAARSDHGAAIWRLAMLQAAGEGMPRDRAKAQVHSRSLSDQGDVNGMLLLGELHARKGEHETAGQWWERASELDSTQARALLQLSEWRHLDPVTGSRAYVEVDHLYQGWNNCGATSIAMFARQAGSDTTPYAVKRLCPQRPIGTGTDWADLIAAGESLGQQWDLVTFANDDTGFRQGVEIIRKHLDARRPVVIDFTVTVNQGDRVRHSGHTLLVVGYHAELDQFVLKNPNQPSPGIQLMTAEELKANWYSRGYSRLAKGQVARPLIVKREP